MGAQSTREPSMALASPSPSPSEPGSLAATQATLATCHARAAELAAVATQPEPGVSPVLLGCKDLGAGVIA